MTRRLRPEFVGTYRGIIRKLGFFGGAEVRPSTLGIPGTWDCCFHLLKNKSPLVLKGIYHYWTCFFGFQGSYPNGRLVTMGPTPIFSQHLLHGRQEMVLGWIRLGAATKLGFVMAG